MSKEHATDGKITAPEIERDPKSIQTEEIQESYQKIAEEIATREEQLTDILPIETPYGINRCLVEQQNQWQTNVKSLRSVPVLNVYDQILDEKVAEAEELQQILVCLDATINILDDIIDTANADRDQRINHAVNVAFAQTVALSRIPSEYSESVTNLLVKYLTEVFQIPRVEEELLKKFEETPSRERETRLEIARSIYAYRGHTISAFGCIPALIYEMDDWKTKQVVTDLELFRARQLIYKDLADVKRDLEDSDRTIVLSLIEDPNTDTPQIRDFIDELHHQFSYSEESQGEYQRVLETMDRRPQNLQKEIQRRENDVQGLSGREGLRTD